MKNRAKAAAIAVGIPVAYAAILRLLFDLDILRNFTEVMSMSFFIIVPFVVGFLTVLLSPFQKLSNGWYAFFAPWISIFAFLVVTLLLSIEGWACWIMILPVFLLFGSFGGIFARYLILRGKQKPNKLQVSILLFLPMLAAPVEKLLPDLPARYEAYTYADIHAPAARIWANVVRVRAIPDQADRGALTRFLGFPRPIRAELDYAGVGGSRQAIFSKGLVFTEVVLEYADQRRMHFSITANPHDIPSTTMDKHVVIGGDYFNVLDGTYELRQLNDSVCRLHLYSHFTLRTTFNFYASWWAGCIMKDIQNNILQVIQTRCERNL
jgi:hypothetical protein